MEHLPNDPPLWVDGTPAGVSFGTVAETAARYTLLIGDVAGLYRKLQFERDQFSRAHHSDPPYIDGIVYHCLNFIITAQSLYEWLKKEIEVRDATGFDKAKFEASLARLGPYRGLCRDIGNTLKHRDFRDGLWPGGRVKLDYLPGHPDGHKPLAVLLFQQPNGMSDDAANMLNVIVMHWGMILRDYGVLPDPAARPASANTGTP